MADEAARVVVEHFSFAYPGASRAALRDINLTIDPGELVLLAGPSGCGKSTLALALSGLVPQRVRGRTAGQVYIGRRRLAEMEISQISQLVGIVFQNPDDQLIHPMVEDEVAFGPQNLALAPEEVRSRVEEALTATGMTRMRRALTASLSGGEKQRGAIAATLAMRPQVLILDEPCSDLDPVGAQEVLAVLRDLNRRENTTIILIEHRIDEVAPWVDRVVLMGEGRIVLDLPTRAAFADPAPWNELGVAVPETVRLARALPQVFTGLLPLSSAEAADGLASTPFGLALAGSAARRPPGQQPDLRPAVVTWREVSLAFAQRPVLHRVDLALRKGQWMAVAGPNGSGKTSLAGLAMGFQAATGGLVEIEGKPVDAHRVSRQTRHIGYLFQAADTMLFSRSVEAELTFSHRWGGHPLDRDWLEELLAILDLGARRDADPFALSLGQRQRLALAALLATAPPTLILDEPTTGQDEAHASAFLQLLEGLRRDRQLTYLMITHDMRAVARHADWLVVLADGNVLLEGPPSQVFAQREALREAHLVPPPMADLHGRLAQGRARRVALGVEQLLAEARPSVCEAGLRAR